MFQYDSLAQEPCLNIICPGLMDAVQCILLCSPLCQSSFFLPLGSERMCETNSFFWRVGRLNSEPIPKGCISQWHAQEMAKEALKGDLPWPHASQLCWKLLEKSSIWQIWLTFLFQAWAHMGIAFFNFWMQAIYLIVQRLFVPRAQLGEATFCYVAFMHSENVEMVEESCLGLLRSLAAKMCRIHVTHGSLKGTLLG